MESNIINVSGYTSYVLRAKKVLKESMKVFL